ncbi:unnamed protein product, partial [Protopolystoma xenopodis]
MLGLMTLWDPHRQDFVPSDRIECSVNLCRAGWITPFVMRLASGKEYRNERIILTSLDMQTSIIVLVQPVVPSWPSYLRTLRPVPTLWGLIVIASSVIHPSFSHSFCPFIILDSLPPT